MRTVAPVLAPTLAFVLAFGLFAPPAAHAQGWKVYRFPEAGFAVQAPGVLTTAKGEYRTAAGVAAPSTTYALNEADIAYSITVADFTKAPPDQQAAVAEAVKAWGAKGEVKLDVQERIDRQFGRQLSIVGRDGSRSTVSVFFVNGKLYQLEGKALLPDPGSGAGKAVRFQQSLEFIGLGAEANRPENRAGGPGGPGGPRFGPPGGFGGPGGPGGRRGPPPPQAFEACKGKAAGDKVRLTIPNGTVVDANCFQTPQGLAARPDVPLFGRGGPPPPPG